MAVLANTFETYSTGLIFEELHSAFVSLSPMECPYQASVGQGSCNSTYVEWTTVDLAAASATNRVVEGEDAPATDAPTDGVRLGNYTQISDKKVVVSHTSQAVDSAADGILKLAKQVAMKLKELKRDMELMFTQNIAANPGSSGTARVMAGVPAFLTTNTVFEGTGADPTLSGTTDGYPDAAATPGAEGEFLEDDFNDMLQACWTNGGDPSLVLVNAANKRIISETFVGNATRYKDTMDKKVMNAIDFYESDFGTVTIVPTRFMLPLDGAGGTNFGVLAIDPEFIEILFLETVREKELGDTGHNFKRLIWCEYTQKITAEAAHGIVRDTDGVMPAP